MTKTAMRELAKRARRYGYYHQGLTLWNFCPTCRERVECDFYPNESIVKLLDASMVLHLEDCGS